MNQPMMPPAPPMGPPMAPGMGGLPPGLLQMLGQGPQANQLLTTLLQAMQQSNSPQASAQVNPLVMALLSGQGGQMPTQGGMGGGY